MSIKLERMQNEFVEKISMIIKEEVKDKEIDFVTITSARISSDLSYAKIYFTCLNLDKKEEIEKALNRASKFIEMKLSEITDIRKMPELTFKYDDSIEYGNKIEEIIEKINNE